MEERCFLILLVGAVCCDVAAPAPSGDGPHRNFPLISKDCGEVFGDKVYRGNKTYALDFPWVALIATERDSVSAFTCTGSVINNRYILTSAHCITELNGRNLAGVRIGEHYISDITGRDYPIESLFTQSGQDIGIEKVIPHPDYVGIKRDGSPDVKNDIGIIRFKKAIDMTEDIIPVCLPYKRELQTKVLKGKQLTRFGWSFGKFGMNGRHPSNESILREDLLKFEENITSTEICSRIINNGVASPGEDFHQLCGTANSCFKGSGDPLVYKETLVFGDTVAQRWVQYGVSTTRLGLCGQKEDHDVFNNVAHYIDWILDRLEP